MRDSVSRGLFRAVRARGPLALCIACTGCYSTVVRSGLPAGTSPAGWEERWHASFLFGAVESRPGDLRLVCPQGWSEIRGQTSFLQGVLHVLSLFVYTPGTVTVVCAGQPGDPPPRPGEGALPPS